MYFRYIYIIYFLVITHAYSTWYSSAHRAYSIHFQVIPDENGQKAYLKIKIPEAKKGVVFLYYSTKGKIEHLPDLEKAIFWKVIKYNKSIGEVFIPQSSGEYHFMAAYLEPSNDDNHNYVLKKGDKFVVLKAGSITSEQSDQNLQDNLNDDIESSKMTLLSSHNKGSEAKPSVKEIEIISTLLSEIRKLKVDLEDNFQNKEVFDHLDIYSFLIRYSSITTQIDNLYFRFLINKYNWTYLPKVNREYNELNKVVLQINKNILKSVQSESP